LGHAAYKTPKGFQALIAVGVGGFVHQTHQVKYCIHCPLWAIRIVMSAIRDNGFGFVARVIGLSIFGLSFCCPHAWQLLDSILQRLQLQVRVAPVDLSGLVAGQFHPQLRRNTGIGKGAGE